MKISTGKILNVLAIVYFVILIGFIILGIFKYLKTLYILRKNKEEKVNFKDEQRKVFK